jgi:hypothetical protein
MNGIPANNVRMFVPKLAHKRFLFTFHDLGAALGFVSVLHFFGGFCLFSNTGETGQTGIKTILRRIGLEPIWVWGRAAPPHFGFGEFSEDGRRTLFGAGTGRVVSESRFLIGLGVGPVFFEGTMVAAGADCPCTVRRRELCRIVAWPRWRGSVRESSVHWQRGVFVKSI